MGMAVARHALSTHSPCPSYDVAPWDLKDTEYSSAPNFNSRDLFQLAYCFFAFCLLIGAGFIWQCCLPNWRSQKYLTRFSVPSLTVQFRIYHTLPAKSWYGSAMKNGPESWTIQKILYWIGTVWYHIGAFCPVQSSSDPIQVKQSANTNFS